MAALAGMPGNTRRTVTEGGELSQIPILISQSWWFETAAIFSFAGFRAESSGKFNAKRRSNP